MLLWFTCFFHPSSLDSGGTLSHHCTNRLFVVEQMVLHCANLCDEYTCRAQVFLMRTLSACLSQPAVTVVLQVTHAHSRLKGSRLRTGTHHCVLPKIVTSHRAMSYVAPHLSTTPTAGTCTPSVTRPTSLSSDTSSR